MILRDVDCGYAARSVKAASERCGRSVQASDIGSRGAWYSAKSFVENKSVQIDGIATCESVDCDGEVVLADGVKWDPIKRYKTMYVDHYYGVRNAVATMRWVKKSGDGWQIRAMMLDPSKFEDVGRVIELAGLSAIGLSIGFVVLSAGPPTPDELKSWPGAGRVIRECEVFEVSFTCMPCNVRCGTTDVYVDESSAEKALVLVKSGKAPRSYQDALSRAVRRRVVAVD